MIPLVPEISPDALLEEWETQVKWAMRAGIQTAPKHATEEGDQLLLLFDPTETLESNMRWMVLFGEPARSYQKHSDHYVGAVPLHPEADPDHLIDDVFKALQGALFRPTPSEGLRLKLAGQNADRDVDDRPPMDSVIAQLLEAHETGTGWGEIIDRMYYLSGRKRKTDFTVEFQVNHAHTEAGMHERILAMIQREFGDDLVYLEEPDESSPGVLIHVF